MIDTKFMNDKCLDMRPRTSSPSEVSAWLGWNMYHLPPELQCHNTPRIVRLLPTYHHYLSYTSAHRLLCCGHKSLDSFGRGTLDHTHTLPCLHLTPCGNPSTQLATQGFLGTISAGQSNGPTVSTTVLSSKGSISSGRSYGPAVFPTVRSSNDD